MIRKESSSHNSSRITRASYFWNAIYGGLNATQAAIILIIVSRTMELSQAGIITIGFTFGNLMMIVANYGMRSHLVSDVKEEHSFSDYYYCRVCTVAICLAVSAFGLFLACSQGKYSFNKTIIIGEIIFYKLIDSIEDLFIARLQQKGRLDIGAKTAAFRTIFSILSIFVSICISRNLVISFLVGIMVSAVFVFLLFPRVCKEFAVISIQAFHFDQLKRLLSLGLVLCAGTTLHNIIGNAPKYLVDRYMTDEMQAISGYIMMPIFVITLLNNFIMQPTVKSLGELWSSHREAELKKKMARHFILIASTSVLVLFAGIIIGLPLLSMLYNISLSAYEREFILLLVGGVLYTLSAYCIMLLTVCRSRKWIIIGCFVSIFFFVLLGKPAVHEYGFTGVSALYIIANGTALMVYVLAILNRINKTQIQ